MPKATLESDDHRPGDKVRIRQGRRAGERAVIRTVSCAQLALELPDGEQLHAGRSLITNFSLAARRAWSSMPKRAGRPPLATPRKKLVSIRLDMDVWRMLIRAAEDGLITNREHAINIWLRHHLAELTQSQLETTGTSERHECHDNDSDATTKELVYVDTMDR